MGYFCNIIFCPIWSHWAIACTFNIEFKFPVRVISSSTAIRARRQEEGLRLLKLLGKYLVDR